MKNIKMEIKTKLFTLILFVGITYPSMGQRPQGMMRLSPEQRVEIANSKMDSVVNLSEDQQIAVNFLHEELYLKDMPERGAIREMTPDQREAFMQQRRVKMEAYREGLQAILTLDQLKAWKMYDEGRRGQQRAKGNSNRGRNKRGQ